MCVIKFKSSHCPNGIFTCFALVNAGWRRCLRWKWHGDHLIVHHQWQHSWTGACKPCLQIRIPDGKIADVLASRLSLTRLSLIQLRPMLWSTKGLGTCHRDLENFPSPDGKIAYVLASTLACTTANVISVNYSLYVPQRPSKVPIASMGKWLTCSPRLTHNCDRFGQLQGVRATETCKFPIAPIGNIADALASTLACAVLELLGTCGRDQKFPHAPMGKLLTRLL
jgi:hypothetical protein